MAYIYILTNKVNGKKYIGQTIQSVSNRLSQHKYNAAYCCGNVIHKAIKKHGWENFAVSSFECSEEVLDAMERVLIALYNTISPDGYNLETGGNKNKHLSEETKNKIAEKRIGNYAKEKHPLWGKHHSEETKRKISENRFDISGINNPRAHKVVCLETGEIFECIKDAERKYNVSGISQCCRRNYKTADGRHWKYFKEESVA